jgi:hypothetical protein
MRLWSLDPALLDRFRKQPRLPHKLAMRSPAHRARILANPPAPHPLFVVVPGDVASWERAS